MEVVAVLWGGMELKWPPQRVAEKGLCISGA